VRERLAAGRRIGALVAQLRTESLGIDPEQYEVAFARVEEVRR
jgi:hypothetical protein